MRAIVDRIEDGVVTLEINNNYFNIPLEKISKQIKEGDIIGYKNGEFLILEEETKDRAEKIQSLFNSLLEKND